MRSEADGYLEKELGEEHERHATSARGEHDDTAKTAPRPTLAIDNVKVRGGRLIPQQAIFELKTHGAHKKRVEQMSEHLPRLWVAHVPFFILAFHDYGLFKPENIVIQDVRKKVTVWQAENQILLRRLGVLLEKLVSMARDPDIDRFEVCLQQPGVLELREPGGKVFPPLPSPLTWIWADQGGSEYASDSSGVSVGAETSDADVAAHSGDDDDDFPEDFTACSDACGYCGQCSYKLR